MPEHFGTIAHAFEKQARKYGSRAFLKQKRDKAWRDFSWSEIADAAAKLQGRPGCDECEAGRSRRDTLGQFSTVGDRRSGGAWPWCDRGSTLHHQRLRGASPRPQGLSAKVVAANGDDMVKKILALGSSIPSVEAAIALHPDASPQAASNGTQRVMTLQSASGESAAPVVEGKREDLATFIYTSGTTGPSKGVMLTHGNLLANAEDAVTVLDVNENDNILSFLPVAHCFERTAGYYTVLLGGGQIAYAEGLAQIPANLQEIKPTLLLVVPRLPRGNLRAGAEGR